MSTGRTARKELYVGFLLFLLTFLYLSHLTLHAEDAPAVRAPIGLKALKLENAGHGDKEVQNG